MGKGKFLQLPIWITQRGLSALGFQTGPFAACEANFVLEIFHFHIGEPILITLESQFWEREIALCVHHIRNVKLIFTKP